MRKILQKCQILEFMRFRSLKSAFSSMRLRSSATPQNSSLYLRLVALGIIFSILGVWQFLFLPSSGVIR